MRICTLAGPSDVATLPAHFASSNGMGRRHRTFFGGAVEAAMGPKLGRAAYRHTEHEENMSGQSQDWQD